MSMLAKRNNIEKKSEKDHKVDLVKFSDVEQVYNRIAYNGKQTYGLHYNLTNSLIV